MDFEFWPGIKKLCNDLFAENLNFLSVALCLVEHLFYHIWTQWLNKYYISSNQWSAQTAILEMYYGCLALHTSFELHIDD